MNPEKLQLSPTDNTVLVTHKGCLDGTGAAFVFLLAGGKLENIIFRAPSNLTLLETELPTNASEVWYADCCPTDLVDPCCGLPFQVIDHHHTNSVRADHLPNCHFRMDRSGTSFLADVLGISHGPVIKAIEDYDLGRFDSPRATFIADLASTYTQEDMLQLLRWGTQEEIFSNPMIGARVAGVTAMRKLYASEAARQALYIDRFSLGGTEYRVGIVLSPVQWKNAVSQQILQDSDVAIVLDLINGMVSLRSKDVDVSSIAMMYGGGGHKAAAAFKINSHSALRKLSEEIFG